jgi:hypothetical protein
MKQTQILSVGLALLFSITSANAIVIFGNLGTVNASTTSNTVGYLNNSQQNQFQAQGFTMGSSDFEIDSIEFGFGSSGSPSPLVEIYGSALNGVPSGAALSTFSLSAAGAVSAKAIYTFGGSFTASKNTAYWVVVSNSNSAAQESFEWYSNDSFTQPSQENASGITYSGTRERDGFGGSWNNTLSSLSIRVSGSAVPEPSALALLGLGTVGFFARRRRMA